MGKEKGKSNITNITKDRPGFHAREGITSSERKAMGWELFPPMDMSRLPEALRSERLREEVLEDIRRAPRARQVFEDLEPEYQESLMGFFMGNRGLNMLYDPFFKKIMTKPRLERLLSQILGQKVVIVEEEHFDASRRSAEASVMVMDIVVKLEDGSYVDLEIQRITNEFPFNRAVCYFADIMVNQYDQLKMEQKQAAKDWNAWKKRQEERERMGITGQPETDEEPEPAVAFNYESLRPVYVVVIMNSGAAKYRAFPNNYIHRSPDVVEFDTGLKEDALHKYIFITLDIFRKIKHNEKEGRGQQGAASPNIQVEKSGTDKNGTGRDGAEKDAAGRMTELEAWMYFLSSDRPEDICRLVQEYPEFEALYQEIVWFRYHPEEMMQMIPEAIKMMDDGTVKLEIDRLHEKVDKLMEELEDKDRALEDKDRALEDKDRALEDKDRALEDKDRALEDKDRALEDKDRALEDKDRALEDKDSEIANLRRALAEYQRK